MGSGYLAGEAAGEQLLHCFEIRALSCGQVDSRKDTFAVLEDVETEGDGDLMCRCGV